MRCFVSCNKPNCSLIHVDPLLGLILTSFLPTILWRWTKLDIKRLHRWSTARPCLLAHRHSLKSFLRVLPICCMLGPRELQLDRYREGRWRRRWRSTPASFLNQLPSVAALFLIQGVLHACHAHLCAASYSAGGESARVNTRCVSSVEYDSTCALLRLCCGPATPLGTCKAGHRRFYHLLDFTTPRMLVACYQAASSRDPGTRSILCCCPAAHIARTRFLAPVLCSRARACWL